MHIWREDTTINMQEYVNPVKGKEHKMIALCDYIFLISFPDISFKIVSPSF